MSRRFGRNQRRRMREEIALQAMLLRQTRASLESESAGRLKEKRARVALEHEMAEWAERIASLLGPESAFAREVSEMGLDPGLFHSVAHEGRPLAVEPRSTLTRVAGGMTMREAREIIDLFATTATPERDGAAYRWRFLIRGKDGAAALMMDERTIYTLKRNGDRALRDHLVRQLVEPWMEGRVG